jgi:hypothetical protein
MVSCNNCIHYDICIFHIKGDEYKKCPHFKNKVNFVEVVRCKDCEYHDYICKHPDGLFRTTDNSYCSFGKRKEKK